MFKRNLYVLLTTLLSGLYGVVDQISISHISHEYLVAESLVCYAAMGYLLLARAVGQVYLAVGRKDGNEGADGQAYSFMLYAGLLIAASLAFGQKYLMHAFNVPNLPGVYGHVLIYIFTAMFIGLNLLMKHIVIGKKKQAKAFYADLGGNILNLVGNTFCVVYLPAGEAFIGVALISLVSQLFVNLYLHKLLRLQSRKGPSFIWGAKSLIASEVFSNILRVVAPFIVTLYVRDRFGDMYCVAYNMAIYFWFMLERPFIALSMVAMPEFANNSFRVVALAITGISAFWSVLLLPLFCMIPWVVVHLYHIKDFSLIVSILGILAPCLLTAATLLQLCVLRVRERQAALSFVDLLTCDLAAIVLLWALAPFIPNVPLLFTLAFGVPKLIRILIVRGLARPLLLENGWK